MEYQLINPRRPGTSAIEQVLLNRGIKDVQHYLNTVDSDILSPLDLDNMKKGVELLVSHIAQGSKTFVIVDSDCDGYCSSAILINYLNHLFPAFVQNNISYSPHTGKQHGIILDMIPEDVKLVIAPDSASSDYEQHEELAKRGVDVLVIDHHEAPAVSEYACVINNQLCDYANKALCGGAMVYKFCCYIDSLMRTDYAVEYLDLVALSLVADMMDLREYETKHLIGLGLKQITNPYFKGMTIKNEYSLGGKVTPFGVAFYIAPYVNAVTRSGTMEEKIVLFESMLDFKAYELIPSIKRGHKPGEMETRVEQACRNCTNIKNRQTKTRDASLEIIEQIIEEQNLLDNKVLLIKLSEAQRTTLGGLIANQLMSIYQRPVLILSQTQHEVLNEQGKVVDTEIWWEGSGRGPNVPGLEDCRSFYESSGLVEYGQGHANAFGLGVRDVKIDEFLNWCNNALKDFDFTPNYKVDFIFDAKTLSENKYDLYNLIEYNDIWGQEVEQPKIAVKDLVITKDNIQLMKGTTLKIMTPGEPDVAFIKFKVTEQEFEILSPSDLGCVTIDVIGVCERNSYNDKPQIIIKDYEIKDRQEYYF
jgi:single-stranded-DNA-specific exonuclease